LKIKVKENGNRLLTGNFKQNVLETPANKRILIFMRRSPAFELSSQHML
jgi:hypothetical protein